MSESRGKGYWCGLGLVGVLLLSKAGVAMPEPIEKSLNRKPPVANRIEVIGQTTDLSTLELENPIDREMSAGETHRYQVFLEAGQYFRVTVAQSDIDAAIAPDETMQTNVVT